MGNELFDIRDFEFFQNKNLFSGSVGDFQYKIIPDTTDKLFKIFIWRGKLCLEKSEILLQQEFEFTEQGLKDAVNLIKASYENMGK